MRSDKSITLLQPPLPICLIINYCVHAGEDDEDWDSIEDEDDECDEDWDEPFIESDDGDGDFDTSGRALDENPYGDLDD